MSSDGEKVLIVGAGPTGLTCAIELARRGLAPRIIDRKSGPTPLSKAVGVSSHSLDLLAPSGVADQLLEDGVRIRRAHIRSGSGAELGAIDFSHIPHRHNFLLALPQSETERLMVETLARLGVAVEWRTALSNLEPSEDAIVAHLSDSDDESGAPATDGGPARAHRFDRVFGADGVHSVVRACAKIDFAGYTHRREWSIADFEDAGWPFEPDAAQIFAKDGGDVAIVISIAPGRFRAVANTPEALPALPIPPSQTRRLLRADRFHIPVRQAEVYQKGRVFLGGDAAHVHSPVGGRGMNLGIEDAALFARLVAEGTTENYTRQRWPIGRRWIDFSERALKVAQAQGPLLRPMRDLMFRIVGHAPLLQGPLLERVAGLRE